MAVVAADQSHHQAIKIGNAPSVSSSVFKPHGAHVASVVSQPHAAPQSVNSYGNNEKPVAGVHAPAALPHSVAYAPAPVVHAAPIVHAAPAAYGAPVVHAAPTAYGAPVKTAYDAPVVHAAPVIEAAYGAPVKTAYDAPVVHDAPVVKAAPAYHAPAPYHEEKETPEPYSYTYGVADDYSKAAFSAAETANADGAVTGEYTVALPDGRTQHVKYTADHYNGFVAEVTYEGVPVYPEAKSYAPAPVKPSYAPAPAKPSYAPAPAPAYAPAPAPAYAPAPAPAYAPAPAPAYASAPAPAYAPEPAPAYAPAPAPAYAPAPAPAYEPAPAPAYAPAPAPAYAPAPTPAYHA